MVVGRNGERGEKWTEISVKFLVTREFVMCICLDY